jgi:tetratricopeptide (TPR) repeat protein
MAEVALQIARDCDEDRRSQRSDPNAGRYILRLRQDHPGKMALMEAGKAISAGGAHDRAGGLLMEVIEDSKRSGEPRVGGELGIDLYGYAACKILSEILDIEGASLDADAAFYAGHGYSFRGKPDQALGAFRMSATVGARTGDLDYPARSLLEIGDVYYTDKEAYLEAGLAYIACAERYRSHRLVAEAARRAEKAFNMAKDEGDHLDRLKRRARELTTITGQGLAPVRFRFESGQDSMRKKKYEEAAREFEGIPPTVPDTKNPGTEIPVPFYLIAQVKAGECYFYIYKEGKDPKDLEKSLRILTQALQDAEKAADHKAWAMAAYTLGALVHASTEVGDAAAAAEVLSAFDAQPQLDKEVAYAAPARAAQAQALVKLGRQAEAEAVFVKLEALIGKGKDGATADAIHLYVFNAAYEIAVALQEGGLEAKAGKYARRIAEMLPLLKPQPRTDPYFQTLAWSCSLSSAASDHEMVLDSGGKLLKLYEENWEDTVVLREGKKKIVGEVVHEDEEEVRILTGGEVQTYTKIEVDRVIRKTAEKQPIVDQTRTNMAESLLKTGKVRESVDLYKLMYERPGYSGEYRILEGYAEAMIALFQQTKDDRWLTPKGSARDLLQILWARLGGMAPEDFEKIKRAGDPPLEKKRWIIQIRILEVAYMEENFEYVVMQIKQILKLNAPEDKEILDKLTDLQQRAQSHMR